MSLIIDPLAMIFVAAFVMGLVGFVAWCIVLVIASRRSGETSLALQREYHAHLERMQAAERLTGADRVTLANVYRIAPSEVARAIIDGDIEVKQLMEGRS